MPTYGKVDYWEDRYKGDGGPFDWFQKYAALKPILSELGLQPDWSILVVGCGTSTVSEDLYEDGFRQITNIDFSPTCINLMEKKLGARTEMRFLVMDVLDMSELKGEQFDLIFDKGVLDCVLCSEKSFDMTTVMLEGISSLLAPNGTYLIVSYGAPPFRLSHLQQEKYGWTVTMKTVQKPAIAIQIPVDEAHNVHYVYLCTKNSTTTSNPEEEEAKRREVITTDNKRGGGGGEETDI